MNFFLLSLQPPQLGWNCRTKLKG